MAQGHDPSHHGSAAPQTWVLNPALLILVVCSLLVLALAPAARESLIVLIIVGGAGFLVGWLARGGEAARHSH